jgi:hypothetical protein
LAIDDGVDDFIAIPADREFGIVDQRIGSFEALFVALVCGLKRGLPASQVVLEAFRGNALDT